MFGGVEVGQGVGRVQSLEPAFEEVPLQLP